jgi:hypothetical protein
MQKLNLNELLVNKMAKIVERLVGNGNGILINFILGQDIRDVEADENDIEQLILNIAIKARHEIKKGGNLIISTKNVSVNHAKERNASQMAPDFYVNISFFYNMDGSFRNGENTDISLSRATKANEIKTMLLKVYEIVERFDGYMNIHHSHGKSLTLNVLVPVYPNLRKNLHGT